MTCQTKDSCFVIIYLRSKQFRGLIELTFGVIMLTQLGTNWALIGTDFGSLGGTFSDPKVGSGGGTAYELKNSKNSIFEAIRRWYHLNIVSQVVVPPY